MVAVAARDIFSAAGLELMGEIISWSFHAGGKFGILQLRDALRGAGFEPELAKDMSHVNAFRRAAKKLEEGRIIRIVANTEDRVVFQFTRESLSGDKLNYDYEAHVTLEKDTGDVFSTVPDLVVLAKARMDEQIGLRSTNDVTHMLKGIFAKQADLFSVRDGGGVYFVPQRFADFLERIDTFVVALGGRLNRFPVPKGTSQGARSVKQAVSDGIDEMIAKHLEAIDGFDPESTRDDTLERAADKIKETRFKVECYGEYLEEAKARLLASVKAARDRLKEKMGEVRKAREEQEAVA